MRRLDFGDFRYKAARLVADKHALEKHDQLKGVGNLADFEAAASKGKAPCVSQSFAAELKTKTINQIIEEVDKFYQENPGKLSTSVLEVILIRCTKACPPGYEAGAKK